MNREELIIEIIQKITEGIITDIGSVGDLFDNAQKAGLLESIFARLDELGLSLSDIFPEAIAEQYALGLATGEAALIEAGIGAGALVATSPKKRIHIEALDELISEGMGDLKGAIATIRESMSDRLDTILENVTKDLGTSILTGENRKAATARISQTFAKEGLTAFVVKDKNGKKRNLPLDFYAATVTKTKLRTAHNKATENRYRENNVDLVIVDVHSPTCKECASKQGIVLSLTGDTKGYQIASEVGLPPYHPNCRHTIRPYILKFKTLEEIAQDKKRKYKPDVDPRSDAQKKVYAKEQAIKRKANEEKKAYEKIKAALGDKAPKTLGAFRRLRRKNDPRFIELQKQYREAIDIQDSELESG